MRMKTCLLWIALVIGLLSGLTLLVWTQSRSSFVKAFQRAAEAALHSNERIVDISAVTDFEWDTMYVFGPYTPVETIDSQLGFDWPGAEKTHIYSSDTFYLLVFVKNQKVVKYFKVPRTIGDFQDFEAGNMFPRGGDLFEVSLASSGTTSNRMLFTPKRTAQKGLHQNPAKP